MFSARNPFAPKAARTAALFFLTASVVPAIASAASLPQSELEALRKEVDDLRRRDAEKERKIRDLETAVQTLRTAPESSPSDDLERAVREVSAGVDTAPAAVQRSGAAAGPLRLIDLSWDSLFAGGTSTATDAQLRNLQGGGHDPKKRGFTVQNDELSLSGAVDPYFNAEAHVVFQIDPTTGETSVELEEAFATTTSLPWGLEVKAGQFFTEFGRINPRHPHQWEFLDQPVVNSRFFGEDGLRGAGLRIGRLLPVDWYSEVYAGVQNAAGETTQSFLANEEVFAERPIGGRPFVERDVETVGDLLYLLRWDNGFDLTDEWSMKIGASALHGPNATGADGDTWIYGADLLVKWRATSNERGWPFVIWQSEIMNRDYHAARFVDEGNPLDPNDDLLVAGERLRDWGLYSQLLWGFAPRFIAGVRVEYASGSGDGYDAVARASADRSDDPFRDDRFRFSFLLSYLPTEFSRLRLQYNFDDAEHLDEGQAHSLWLGLEILLGTHAAHTY